MPERAKTPSTTARASDSDSVGLLVGFASAAAAAGGDGGICGVSTFSDHVSLQHGAAAADAELCTPTRRYNDPQQAAAAAAAGVDGWFKRALSGAEAQQGITAAESAGPSPAAPSGIEQPAGSPCKKLKTACLLLPEERAEAEAAAGSMPRAEANFLVCNEQGAEGCSSRSRRQRGKAAARALFAAALAATTAAARAPAASAAVAAASAFKGHHLQVWQYLPILRQHFPTADNLKQVIQALHREGVVVKAREKVLKKAVLSATWTLPAGKSQLASAEQPSRTAVGDTKLTLASEEIWAMMLDGSSKRHDAGKTTMETLADCGSHPKCEERAYLSDLLSVAGLLWQLLGTEDAGEPDWQAAGLGAVIEEARQTGSQTFSGSSTVMCAVLKKALGLQANG